MQEKPIDASGFIVAGKLIRLWACKKFITSRTEDFRLSVGVLGTDTA